jgi:hypothetical protein
MRPAKGVSLFIREAEWDCLTAQFHSSHALWGAVSGQLLHSKGFCTKAVQKQRRRGERECAFAGVKARAGPLAEWPRLVLRRPPGSGEPPGQIHPGASGGFP